MTPISWRLFQNGVGASLLQRSHIVSGLKLSLLLALVCQIGCGGLTVYNVTLSAVEICIIRPGGEFCDPEETFPAPSSQNWSVEKTDTHTIIYADTATWIADGIEGERSVIKEERVTQDACVTTTSRNLLFNENLEDFTGTLEEKVRLVGDETCGDTPWGTRQLFQLTGLVSDSI
jgi:hypothetical protein